MGDWNQQLVAPDLPRNDADFVAKKVHEWLLDSQIIAEPKTNCVLGSEDGLGYPPGQKVGAMLEAPTEQEVESMRAQLTNGFEICSEAKIYHLYQGFPEHFTYRCSNCDSILTDEFFGDCVAKLDDWIEDEQLGNVDCPDCGLSSLVSDWITDPPCLMFSNFGVTIWKWRTVSDEFIREMSKMTGSKIYLLESKV